MTSSPPIPEKSPSPQTGDEKGLGPPESSSRISIEPTLAPDSDNSPSSSDEADSPVLSRYDSSWIRRTATPKNCRWDPKSPKRLTVGYCVLYALAGAFTVANLYYNQPILNKMAAEFDVSYETSSQVATLIQAGYATGLVFVLPLGDILERRPFIIVLILATATMWIGLCVTKDFTAFRALSFVCGVTTVTPQLMIPLVGDFAPAHRKSSLLSIVVSGLGIGLLTARLLSGVVSNFTNWRNIYWFGCGAQYLLAGLLFFFMPDYPSTNPDGLNYFRALFSIPQMMVTEPVLIQACAVTFCLSCIFTSFWTTLTFLLASHPFNFSSLEIGLFSLTGLVTIVCIPIIGRIIDRFVPIVSTVAGLTVSMTGTVIGTIIGPWTVAGPVLQAIGIDLGNQTAQVANRAAIFNINPKARNRVNTAYMACGFFGQLTGTAVGNRLYAQGGWRYSAGCSVGVVGLALIFAFSRGPRETGWIGWKGGWSPRKDVPAPPVQQNVESVIHPITNWKSDNNSGDKEKAPTAISYRASKNEAPDWGYAIPLHRPQFTWFKLLLIDEKDMPENIRMSPFLMGAKQALARQGRTAVQVISDYIRELWDHILKDIERSRGAGMLQASKLNVVVTVPAIWPHYARLRMKSALQAARVLDKRQAGVTSLTFVSEPEAAALATLKDMNSQPNVNVGDSIVVCDAGGGTMDIITYTVIKKKPFTIREIVKGDGKICGAMFLDQGFNALLKSRIHRSTWNKLGEAGLRRITKTEWHDSIKPSFCKDSAGWEIVIPFGGTVEDGYRSPTISIHRKDIENIYKPIVGQIEELVKSQIRQVRAQSRKKPKFLILVGGFGKSKYLFECLKDVGGKQMEVLQAGGERPWTAICRGAVIKGMELANLNKSVSVMVDSRISRGNYGTLVNILPFDSKEHDPADRTWCKINQAWIAAEQTKWFLKMGEPIRADKPVSYNFWQDTSGPEDEHIVDIVYSEAREAPRRNDSSVQTLCEIRLSQIPDWNRLPTWTNTNGEEFRRINYELQMLSDGTSLDFSIYHGGKQLGCQNVAIKFVVDDDNDAAQPSLPLLPMASFAPSKPSVGHTKRYS